MYHCETFGFSKFRDNTWANSQIKNSGKKMWPRMDPTNGHDAE